MTIIYKDGNIFNTSCAVIVCPVNVVGIMGAGMALKAKQLDHSAYLAYRRWCSKRQADEDRIATVDFINDKYLMLFVTKYHWSDRSNLVDLEVELQRFARQYRKNKPGSFAFPKLGCGCGGLNWVDVRALMLKYLKPLTHLTIEIYGEPDGSDE